MFVQFRFVDRLLIDRMINKYVQFEVIMLFSKSTLMLNVDILSSMLVENIIGALYSLYSYPDCQNNVDTFLSIFAMFYKNSLIFNYN